ncbi:hypothetical protein GCM10025768_08190 [Microbacterium pseudoresistens]|uniref:Glycosyl hydrolase family 67 C-terminal domain-containing protein n=1 Tax=Microbacterium pseudoresistens TaxID=640634 RepID=A0A7Y9JMS8_9MICO|nr:hypothetical protein [Microbacterium pseudoresistens]NYD54655.1 hypothetical protein [Microbacterium pseudoresistens]
MGAPRRRGIVAILVVIALLGAGFGVATVVGDALGIRAEPAQRMGGVAEPATAAPATPSPRLTVVEAPQDERIRVALDELDDAQATAAIDGAATLAVSVPVGASGADDTDDTYRVAGSAEALRIEADTVTGATRGVYDLAAAIRAGRDVRALIGQTVTSRMPLRMVDLGAVGVAVDPEQWRPGTDYSHASKAFADVFLPEAPYIDQTALAAAYDEFDAYVRRMLAEGYNALAFPGFVEFVTFSGVDGVYSDGDEHIAKALALREAFGPFWDRAQELGMKVFLRTDMLTLTSPLESYLTDRFGSLDTTNPDLWQLYAAGLDELYAAEPSLDGVLVRIGEAGRVYDVEGWDYYSSLAVTTTDAVRAMLTALTAQAEASDREVIFRTWSVGVGAVGDMHTDTDSYEAVLGGIDSPALIVSTKYTLGDFYSWLPLNDTLLQGDQRRIVEFQSRREFENNGAFPNDLGAEYQWALQKLLAGNDRIEGIWAWAQDGGPWRAGPMILYGKAGFWQLADLNAQLAVRLARDPDGDPGGITVDWARQWFSDDPATIQAIADAMALSRTAIEQGLYIPPFAEQRVAAIGLEPPPMMWIFEWDILTGDSAVLDVIYKISRDRFGEAVDGGAAASDAVERMRTLIAGTDAATWRDPELRTRFLGALDYEQDTLDLLGHYRAMVLQQARWHDTLSGDAYAAWQSARDDFETAAAAHLATYEGDVDHPAYNLAAAQLGVERADRDLAMSWCARVLLVLALTWLVIGMMSARMRIVRRPGAAAARATWLASTRPWRAAESTLGMLSADRMLLVAVPGALLVATRAVQTSMLSWTHLAITLGAWAVFVAVTLLLSRRHSPWPLLSAVGGVIVLRCVLTLFALSFTGPGGYWFAFWTDPVRRSLYITIAFALFVWLFVAAGWALAATRGARRATGVVLAGVGLGLAVPAAVIAIIGLEPAMTLWNDEMGLLPWGLSRILGITVYLEIPAATAAYAAGFGAALAAFGLLLALIPSKRVSAGRPRLEGT